tara:strand:+ start:104 stop:433 length:330 start_codon:yes stop_codon:yes gene_type:complete
MSYKVKDIKMKKPVYTDTNDTSPKNTPDFQHFMETLEAFEKLDREIRKENDRSWNHKDLEARIFANRYRYKEIINQLTSSEKSVASRFQPLMEAWRVNYRIEKGIYDGE